MPQDTPRLYLILPPLTDAAEFKRLLASALAAGDIACVLLRQPAQGDVKSAALALMPLVQERGAAFLVEGDPRLATRLGADGVHVVYSPEAIDGAVSSLGADRIVGNADDDVLIAGFTDHDTDDHALCAIMDEWTSTHDYATRVQNLLGGPNVGASRANGNTFLNPDTVHDEGREDILTGSSGNDWFLFNQDGDGGTRDRVTDMSTFESMFADDIDFIYVDPV